MIGLALLEAAKQSGSRLLDEAIGALQRSLDFFASEGQVSVSWKIRYYLAVACILKSQQAADPLHREAHRQMAAGFVEDATGEAALVGGDIGMLRASTGDGDFSPGLKPEVLGALRKAVGLESRPAKGRASVKGRGKSSTKYGPFLH